MRFLVLSSKVVARMEEKDIVLPSRGAFEHFPQWLEVVGLATMLDEKASRTAGSEQPV